MWATDDSAMHLLQAPLSKVPSVDRPPTLVAERRVRERHPGRGVVLQRPEEEDRDDGWQPDQDRPLET